VFIISNLPLLSQPLFSQPSSVSVLPVSYFPSVSALPDDYSISPVDNFSSSKDNCIYKVRAFIYQKLKSCQTFFIKTVELAKEIGFGIRNTRRNLAELASRGFITLVQQSHGWLITINKKAMISKASQITGTYNTTTSNFNKRSYDKNRIRSHYCRKINAVAAANHLATTRTPKEDVRTWIAGIFKGTHKFDKGIKQVVDIKYQKTMNPFKPASDYLKSLFSSYSVKQRSESIEDQLKKHAQYVKIFREDFKNTFPPRYWHQVEMFFGKSKQAIYSEKGIKFIDSYMVNTYERIKERLKMSYYKDFTSKPSVSFQEKYAKQERTPETIIKKPSELSQEEIYRREYEGWRYNSVNLKAIQWQLKALGLTDINDSILDRAAHLMASGKALSKEDFL